MTASLLQQRWMSAVTAAAYLDRSIEAVYQMVYRREIPFHKRGRKLYFDKQEIDRWIAKVESAA